MFEEKTLLYTVTQKCCKNDRMFIYAVRNVLYVYEHHMALLVCLYDHTSNFVHILFKQYILYYASYEPELTAYAQTEQKSLGLLILKSQNPAGYIRYITERNYQTSYFNSINQPTVEKLTRYNKQYKHLRNFNIG